MQLRTRGELARGRDAAGVLDSKGADEDRSHPQRSHALRASPSPPFVTLSRENAVRNQERNRDNFSLVPRCVDGKVRRNGRNQSQCPADSRTRNGGGGNPLSRLETRPTHPIPPRTSPNSSTLLAALSPPFIRTPLRSSPPKPPLSPTTRTRTIQTILSPVRLLLRLLKRANGPRTKNRRKSSISLRNTRKHITLRSMYGFLCTPHDPVDTNMITGDPAIIAQLDSTSQGHESFPCTPPRS